MMSTATGVSSGASGVNADGTLKKYEPPSPRSRAAMAAFAGDSTTLSSLPWQDLLAADEETGNTPLIWSADQGHTAALEVVLEAVERFSPPLVNTRGYIGNTALARAARGGHVDCVVALLTKASLVDPNIANEKMQYPLHFAAFKKHPAVVRALLDSNKCDLLVVDRKGRTPDMDTSDEAIREMIASAAREKKEACGAQEA